MHKTIKEVSEDLENFKFNTAIASLMEFVNTIYKSGADREVFAKLIILLSPIAPHICEELWQALWNNGGIIKAGWPVYNPMLLVEETVTIVVQVNGKLRSKIDVPADITEERLKEIVCSDAKLRPHLEGKKIKNFIIVPKKIVNIVV